MRVIPSRSGVQRWCFWGGFESGEDGFDGGYEKYGVTKTVAEHLARTCGTHAGEVLEL